MTSPLMLDLIAKERRKIREEIAEEYTEERLQDEAKRSRMPAQEYLQWLVEHRMRLKHPFYGRRGLRYGHGHKGCRR